VSASAAAHNTDPHDSPKPRARRGGVVLIVDDSQDEREMYSTYFRVYGFTAYTSEDGAAGVAMALRLVPDVIVMDLTMPRLDGLAAAQELRRLPRTRHIPIILLTGYPATAIDRGALDADVDVFLTKPCLPEDLETHVRRLLESKGRT